RRGDGERLRRRWCARRQNRFKSPFGDRSDGIHRNSFRIVAVPSVSNGAAGGACARRLRDRSGCGLEAAVRVEDAVPDCLRVTIVLGRSQERIAAAFSVNGVLPRGERYVFSPIATFPDREADQLETAERASVGFEDHFRVRQFSWRTPFLVR